MGADGLGEGFDPPVLIVGLIIVLVFYLMW